LKEVAPAAIGISRGRWNNVRALLRTALALVQPISPGRHRNDLSPDWLALSNELGSRSDKIALSQVLHFCSTRRRLAPGRRGLTEANRTRLRPFDDRGNILALLKLPDVLGRCHPRYGWAIWSCPRRCMTPPVGQNACLTGIRPVSNRMHWPRLLRMAATSATYGGSAGLTPAAGGVARCAFHVVTAPLTKGGSPQLYAPG
jgi:hypothetical protein